MTRLFSHFYIEEELVNHPKTKELLQRFPKTPFTTCQKYTEIFNRHNQNFRIQKENPALILAQKKGKILHDIPPTYGIGAKENAYFSHFLNCPYDCSYCFLQGIYKSAHYIYFLNFEDFKQEMLSKISSLKEKMTFFSGYDADSLAFESITGFVQEFLPFFQKHPLAELELRTKSGITEPLLSLKPTPNIIVAYTLSPKLIAENIEKKAPSLETRMKALKTLQKAGYWIGLRFDPIIYHEGYKKTYADFFEMVFAQIDHSLLHSITLGVFRLPKTLYKNMIKIMPQSPLLSAGLKEKNDKVSYHENIEEEVLAFCKNKILEYTSSEKLFIC